MEGPSQKTKTKMEEICQKAGFVNGAFIIIIIIIILASLVYLFLKFSHFDLWIVTFLGN